MVDIVGSNGADTLPGTINSERIIALDGNDQIILDFNLGGGADTVDGGTGFDTVVFTATAGADSILLSASGTHETGRLNGALAFDLVGVETVTVRSGAGADNIQVDFNRGTEARNINVDLSGATLGVADGALDTVKVVGSTNSDFIVVLGSTDASLLQVVENKVNRSPVEITGRDAFDRVVVDASAGNDEFLVDLGTRLGLVTLDGGAGFDSVKAFVENKFDTITFSDFGRHVARGTASVDLTGIETFNMELVGSFGGRNTLVLEGSAAAGFYDVTKLSSTSLTVFQSEQGGPGSPQINILNFADDLVSINAGGGDDILAWQGGIVEFNGGEGFDIANASLGTSGSVVLSKGAPRINGPGGGSLVLPNVERLDLGGSFSGSNTNILDFATGVGPDIHVFMAGSSPADSLFVTSTRAMDVGFVFSLATPTIQSITGFSSPITVHDFTAVDVIAIGGHLTDDKIDGSGSVVKLRLNGGDGNDSLTGGIGADVLFGGNGNDTLQSHGDSDRLDGSLDDDLLIGGGGNDLFVFDAGIDVGRDTVMNFRHTDVFGAHDRIEISRALGNSVSDLISRGFMKQMGDDVILANGFFNSFTIKNTLLLSLSNSDFLFV